MRKFGGDGPPARLIEPLSRFRFYDAPYREAMQDTLDTIVKSPGLSKNVQELVTKALVTKAAGG